jgi:hypothetical protein
MLKNIILILFYIYFKAYTCENYTFFLYMVRFSLFYIALKLNMDNMWTERTPKLIIKIRQIYNQHERINLTVACCLRGFSERK